MSELQLGLLAIGAVVVVAVLAYNKWQELRYRRQAERSFASHADVLMEPAGAAAPPATATASRPAKADVPELQDRVEPRIEPSLEQHHEPAAPAEAPTAGSLSGLIDCIVELQGARPLQTSAAIERAAALLKNFSKSVHLEAWDEDHALWTTARHGHSASRLRAGLQLVDRRGAVSAEEIARFGRAMQQLATELGGSADAVDESDMGGRAQALDRFCGEVDIQIALNVLADGAVFSGPAVRDFAAATGFGLEDDGRFRFRDEAGRELCALANAENASFVRGTLDNLSTSAVTFELDVPRVPGGVQAFDACAAAARQFAGALAGQLADDNRAALSEAGIASIRAQLEPVYAAMAAQGIPAGSPQALRLFS